MTCYRNMLLLFICVLLIITGCKNQKIENAFYKPYLDSATKNSQYRMSGILDSLEIWFEKAPPGIKDLATYYKLKALYHTTTGNYTLSLKVLDTLKRFLNDHRSAPFYREMYPSTLLLIAEGYSELGLYDEAMDLLLTTKKFIDENLPGGCSEADYQSRIAEMLTLQGRNRMAIIHFLHSYDAAQQCDSTSFDQFYHSYSSLYKTSVCYHRLGVYDSAQHFADAAMNYVITNEPRFPEEADYFVLCKAIINGSVAAIKTSLKEYDEAEQLLLATIEQTEKAYPSYVLFCKLDLMDIYLETNQLAKAKQLLIFFDAAAKSNSTYFSDFQQNKLATLKKTYYYKTGNLEQSIYFAEQVIRYQDSLRSVERNEIDTDPALEFENKSQVLANELLQGQYKHRSLQLLASVLLIILVVIIAGFFAFHSKRSAKYARMQEYLNYEIQLKNDELKHAYTSLQSSYQENKELMLAVAHDLKNPIVGITNMAKVLLRRDLPTIKEDLKLIVSASINATDLIGNLMSKKGKRYEGSEKRNEDLMAVVAYSVNLMESKAMQKKQKLELDGITAKVNLNKSEMQRVVNNIINNAIKFSPKNTCISLWLRKQGPYIVLAVKDEGIGIPEHMLEKLFADDTDIQRTGTSGEASYGLGLKISKRIVEEHKGRIWAESVEGQGSTFFVQLPIAENLIIEPIAEVVEEAEH